MPSELLTIAVITTTEASQAQAEQLARHAVQQRLAACAQIDTITSHYMWQGNMESNAEWRITFKTTSALQHALCAWLREQHSYEVPQLLMRTEQALPDYAKWLHQQVR